MSPEREQAPCPKPGSVGQPDDPFPHKMRHLACQNEIRLRIVRGIRHAHLNHLAVAGVWPENLQAKRRAAAYPDHARPTQKHELWRAINLIPEAQITTEGSQHRNGFRREPQGQRRIRQPLELIALVPAPGLFALRIDDDPDHSDFGR